MNTVVKLYRSIVEIMGLDDEVNAPFDQVEGHPAKRGNLQLLLHVELVVFHLADLLSDEVQVTDLKPSQNLMNYLPRT